MPAVTHPVFAEVDFTRGGARLEAEGRKVDATIVACVSGFVLFNSKPIAAGVFKCSVAFGTSNIRNLQHIGVLPVSAAAAVSTESFVGDGFADAKIKGWGCRLEGKQAVTAGEAKNGAHDVEFSGKTVEMVVDAEARTVVIGNPDGAQCRFENVAFPVIPAINIHDNTATLESSSHSVESLEEKQARKAPLGFQPGDKCKSKDVNGKEWNLTILQAVDAENFEVLVDDGFRTKWVIHKAHLTMAQEEPPPKSSACALL